MTQPKRTWSRLLFAVGCLLLTRAAQGALVVTYWTFPVAVTNNVTSDFNIQPGTASVNFNSGTFSTYGPGGTTVNDPRGTPAASQAVLLETANVGGANTASFIITVNRTGLVGMYLSFAANKVHDNPSLTWAWSTDQTTWNNFFTNSSVSAGWTAYSNSVPAAAEGSGTLYFRITEVGVTPADVAFDNIVLSAVVPEPISIALGVFALCAGGIGVGRRIFAGTRS